jgi:hypothetical protein
VLTLNNCRPRGEDKVGEAPRSRAGIARRAILSPGSDG